MNPLLQAPNVPMLLAGEIGSRFSVRADWPTNDLDGLFDALSRWPLDRRVDLSNLPEYRDDPLNAPFRGRAWGNCEKRYNASLARAVYIATKPIYPDYPNAVRYCGNFVGYSFGFWLDTADADLIRRLDSAIAANLERQKLAA